MKFRIHFEYEDGTEDSFVVEGKDVVEIGLQAGIELALRAKADIDSAWSEELR